MKDEEEGIFTLSIRPHGFQSPQLTLSRGDKNVEYRTID